MAVNFGYQPFIGGPKFEGASGLLTPQIVLGARIFWPISFGIQLNGGFNLSRLYASLILAAIIVGLILMLPQRAGQHPGTSD